MLKHLFFGGAGGANRVADFGLLALRVLTGLFLTFGHGRFKMPPGQGFIDFLARMNVPAPTASAWAASLTEFAGGILLALGLFTRPVAIAIVVTMLVAAGTAHLNDPLFMQTAASAWTPGSPPPASKEPALLYLIPALALGFTGSGRFGIDALIAPKKPRILDAR